MKETEELSNVLENPDTSNQDYMLGSTLFDDNDYEIDEPTKEELAKTENSLYLDPSNLPFEKEYIPDPINEGRIFLTDYELATINLNNEKHRNFERENKIIELKDQLIKTQLALLEAKRETLERDAMIVEYHSIQNAKASEEFKAESKKFLIDISNQYDKLKDKKWSYNPDTGEINI